MLDYYSEMPMPDFEVRVNKLFNVSKIWGISKKVPDDVLKNLVIGVITESSEYSLSGYAVFGIKENENNLYIKLLTYQVKNNFNEDFNS